jgi:hypothetical protein
MPANNNIWIIFTNNKGKRTVRTALKFMKSFPLELMLKTHLSLEQTMIELLLPRRPPAGDPQLLREVGINAQPHTTAGTTNLPKRKRLEEVNVALKIFKLPLHYERCDK